MIATGSDERRAWPINGITIALAAAVVAAYATITASFGSGLWGRISDVGDLLLEVSFVWGVIWIVLNAARPITGQARLSPIALIAGCGLPVLLNGVGSVLEMLHGSWDFRDPWSPVYRFRLDLFGVALPLFLGVAMGAILLLESTLMSRISRTKPGFCRKCGYNLTGNVSGVCPECGTEIRGESSSNAFV